MKYKNKNSFGFTVLEIALIFVVAGLVTGVGFLTYSKVKASQNRKNTKTEVTEAKPLQVNEQKAEDKTAVEVPKTEETAKPTPPPPPPPPAKTESKPTTEKPSYTSIYVNLNDVVLDADKAKFRANWENSYAGKCFLTVKNMTTYAYISQEVHVTGTACEFEVPKSQLPSATYKYYITFKNNDYTVKGSSDYKSFSL